MLQGNGPMGQGAEERLLIRTRWNNDSSRRGMGVGNREAVVVKTMLKNKCIGHGM